MASSKVNGKTQVLTGLFFGDGLSGSVVTGLGVGFL